MTPKFVPTPRGCRALAFGTWTLLGGLYVIGQFAFLGWVGPAPVLLGWTVLALPLLTATLLWLRRYVHQLPWGALAGFAAAWLLLVVTALLDPFEALRGIAAWTVFVGSLAFPVVLTFVVLGWVEDRVPVGGTA